MARSTAATAGPVRAPMSAIPAPRVLWRDARLATLADASGWGLVERGALLVRGQTIEWVGAQAGLT